jgi:CHAD domain-containing protein
MEPDYVKLKAIKPALAGYIRQSQSLLKISAVPDENVIHEVRVLMKKSRAALKLAGPQLDSESFKRDLLAFREVGRIMCSWRETSVHRKTLKDLRKENPAIFLQLQDNEKLAALVRKTELIQELTEEIKSELEQLNELLNKAGYRIRFQTMNKIDPQLLLRELELTYTKVVDIYLRCRHTPKPSRLHEFRKKSKDFLYQLYFFRPLNSSVIKALEKKLDLITRNLGKFNDLTQLVKELDYKYPDNVNIPAMDELMVKIREKQDSYLDKVWPAAYKIFCPGQKLVNVLGFKLLVI